MTILPGAEVLEDSCFAGCSNLTTIKIPSSVSKIGESSFYGCSGLTSVSIPAGVKELGWSSFAECTGLTSVSIPAGVTELNDSCFAGCCGLTSVSIPSSVSSLPSNCFKGCIRLTSVDIPSGMVELGDNCFAGCARLSSVNIPSTVIKIGWNCFSGCEKLRNVVVPGGVKEIGEGCFKECSNLSSISIPSSVTSFRDNSFSGCEKLSVITLQTSVSKLGVSCFKNCNNLDTLYFKGAMPIGIVDAEISTTCRIMVPNEHLDTYKEELSSDYRYLEAWNPDDSDEYATEQCATPSISYENGEVRFSCDTPGVKYHYTITDDDIVNKAANKEGKVSLTAAYNISVYASAKGYRLSETAEATLYWLGNEADATNINHVETRGIMTSADRGIVTVYGLKTGETAKFFTIDGQLIGSSSAVDGVASCAVSESLVIIKVGKYSLKLMVQKN